MSTIGIHRIVNGVLTSAEGTTLVVTNRVGTVVVPLVGVTPSSPGIYSYTLPSLPSGMYTATWTFSVAGSPDDVVPRIFQIEAAAAVSAGVSLAEIERAIAARIGPYEQMTAAAGSSPTAVAVRKLASSIVWGDYEDRYILRRGLLDTGALFPEFVSSDRQRIVREYVSALGTLTPDRNWEVAPQLGEVFELHYLDPELLREVALQGLRRCYFWDTIQLAATTYLREINLTAVAPWITRTSQLRQVQYGRYDYDTQNVPWFDAYQSGADIWLRTVTPSIGSVRVKALRPVFSFVNGEDSLVGPNHDADILTVEREYAARAGHVAAWMMQTPKLAPLSVQGLALTMKQAADAFTISSLTYVKTEPERIQNRFTMGDLADFGQVGNA